VNSRIAQKIIHGAEFAECVRFPGVIQLSIELRSAGWPRRPGRAAGSRNDKKQHRSGTIARESARSRTCEWTVRLKWKADDVGFLSLRDPAGAPHAAGPPECLLAHHRTTDPPTNPRGFAAICLSFAALLLTLISSGPLLADNQHELLNKRFDDEIQQLTQQIEKSPKSADLYSRRGDACFFRGKFAQAVADYEKMVELNPDLETLHWRKGIAYFYAGRYKDAAQQFENYHTADNVDRENGIWRYLSQTKALGRDKARAGLLKYEKEDREPFPDVYRLFSGELSGADLLKRIHDAQISPRDREQRLFYAQLYVGLNAFVDGRLESAEKHLGEAAKNNWGSQAGGGPGYMWHVARVHHDLLVAERAAKAK
jgi:lipoprotein NlpI